MIINGYIGFYDPKHRLANKAGIVYEHMIKAEELLGRPLKSGEVVHHIDENKSNNSLNNLMVFKTKNDHTGYHHGGKLIQNSDGTYSTKKVDSDICPYCGMKKDHSAKTCINCYKKNNVFFDPEILPQLQHYRNEMNYSYQKIADIYHVTHTTIRRWFKNLNLI